MTAGNHPRLSNDQTSSITDKVGSTTIGSFAYTYGPGGYAKSETDVGTPGAGTQTFQYDGDHELCYTVSGTPSGSCSSPPSGATSYSYDVDQDLLSSPSPSGNTQFFNNDDQLCWSGTGSGSSCTATPSGDTSYGYSAEGNLTSITPSSGTGTSFDYNAVNELSGYTSSTGTATSYTHDGNGLLQGETTGTSTTSFVWNTSGTLPSLLTDGTNDCIYGQGSTPIEQINISTQTPSYLLSDNSGTPRLLTNSAGSVTSSVTYDKWGNTTGSLATPFGFDGAYHDPASALYYMQARWYDSKTGQFMSIDPDQEATGEAYSYAGNDPTNAEDLSGDLFKSVSNGDQECKESGCQNGVVNVETKPDCGNKCSSHAPTSGASSTNSGGTTSGGGGGAPSSPAYQLPAQGSTPTLTAASTAAAGILPGTSSGSSGAPVSFQTPP